MSVESLRAGRTFRVAVAAGIAALVGGSCVAFGPSELDVHNRTTVAIQWTELDRTNGVLACGSVTFIWNAGWQPKADDEDVDRLLTGVPINMTTAPMGDANVRVAAIVTADGVRRVTRDEVGELPACAGEPVPADSEPVPADS